MGFNRLLSMLLQYDETSFESASLQGGVSSAVNQDALDQQRLADRTRMAQELHDTLLQGIFSVSMQLQEAVAQLREECPATKQRFTGILQLLDRVLDQGRYAVQGLRSPNERIVSLGEALARVPNDLGFRQGDGFRVVVNGKEKELNIGLRDDIYRIAREAIVNACRHSRANEIEVEIRYRSTELRITVRDNGCGIDPQELQWGRLGQAVLLGMRERANRIGARLRLRSSVTLGTEVELCLPARAAFEQSEGFAYGINFNSMARVGR